MTERVPGKSIAKGGPVPEADDRTVDPFDEEPGRCHEEDMQDRVDDPADCSEGLKRVLH